MLPLDRVVDDAHAEAVFRFEEDALDRADADGRAQVSDVGAKPQRHVDGMPGLVVGSAQVGNA